jgi:membrane fusion protein, copper/silver efflux system
MKSIRMVLFNKYVQIAFFTICGLFAGWLFFHSPAVKEEKRQPVTIQKETTIWTCAMHPQIRMPAPGKCPICGMELIPLNRDVSNVDPNAIHLSREAAQLANVITSVVTRQKPIKEVRLYGKVQADERLLQNQVAHIPGRIEKLLVNFTGETVKTGQSLALIYSPELVTAQQELLEAAKTKSSQPEIYEAAKEKLQLWMLTDGQVASIESSGKVQTVFPAVSNTTGIVIDRRVNNGDHVQEGSVLYEIADLSSVWVMFDAYESDLPFLTQGDKLDFTIEAMPGETFTGKINFIDPMVDPVTRVSKIRIEAANHLGKLKPGMFATGIIQANLTMFKDKLVIPRSAVLWTGKRSIVYVRQPGSEEPVFKIREIDLGPMLGSSYIVADGLTEGEEIVTQGTFSVDAAAQLEGKPSMMNQEDAKSSSGPGMDFTMELTSVFDQYIALKNAFVQSDVTLVKEAAQKVQQALAKVDQRVLSGDALAQWTDLSGKMDTRIKHIISSGDLEDQRLAFSGFTDAFYRLLKSYELMGKTVYYQYCPMANKMKGAYWLSESKVIRNPYFGIKMMDCGETREILK